jgi:hypothetical protein
VLFVLPTFTSRQLPGVISLCRQRDGLPVTVALSHHGPGHSGMLVGKRDGGDLARSLYLQDWSPYPRATNTHNSANERSSSNRFRNAKIFVAAVL